MTLRTTSIRSRFTLVEMLVVIAIIGVLAALLLPSLRNAMEAAKDLSCLNNKKVIGIAIFTFADLNDGHCCGNGYKILNSGGSVSWADILNATTLKQESKITARGKPAAGSLGCPNADYITGYNRHVTLNRDLGGVYAVKIEDTGKWPSAPYGADAYYYLGGKLSITHSPSRLIMVADVDNLSGDLFGYWNGSTAPDGTSLLTPSSNAYNNVNSFSFRHAGGLRGSMVFTDGHAELVDSLAQRFRRDNLLCKP